MTSNIVKAFFRLGFLLISSTVVLAQERELKKADEATKESLYQEALDWYHKAEDKGHKFSNREELQMASLYYALGDYDNALTYYASFYEGGFRDTATSLLKYAHCQHLTGDNKGYQATLSQLQNTYPNDSRVLKLEDPFYIRNKRLFEEVHMLTDTIANVIQVVDNKGKLFGANVAQDQDQLVQISNDQQQLLYPEWKFNQGGMSFSADGTTMIVTLNDHKGNRLSYYDRSTSNLNLYRIEKSGDQWGEPQRLSVNLNGYNTANPSLSKEGSVLYFVSDRPGGIGGTDIYRSESLEHGNFGPAKNLGDKINTEGRESYVFIDGSILYFSSDGYPGYGGMDVLATDLRDADQKVFNLGAPINSPYDDFGYSRSHMEGYVSSNRLGQIASYKYVLTTDLVLSEEFDAVITIENKELSFGAPVVAVVKDEDGVAVWQKELVELTDKIRVPKLLNSKEYTLELKGKTIHAVAADIKGALTVDEVAVTASLESSLSEETAIAEQLELADILFDFDRDTTEVSEAVLADYIKVLSSAQSIHIQGFSDQRGLASYNKKLSLRRAEFFKTLLVDNGISAPITVEGLGETNLRFNCRTQKCSDDMERQNRRVELLISF